MKSEHKRRIGEAVALALYFIVDAFEIWPTYHGFALLSAVAGISAILYAECPTRSWLWLSGGMAICGGIAYLIVGPSLPPEPWRGWLQPANEPTPSNVCDELPMSKDAITVLLGDSAFFASKQFLAGRRSFVPLSTSCGPALVVESGPNGMRINLQIFDQSGSRVGSITENGYGIPQGSGLIVEHSADLSALVVHNSEGKELFYIHYLNEHTMRVRGIFACPQAHQMVVIDNETIHPLGRLRHVCSGDSPFGLIVMG